MEGKSEVRRQSIRWKGSLEHREKVGGLVCECSDKVGILLDVENERREIVV